MTSGQYSFCLLLNADWLIQISDGLAVCKEAMGPAGLKIILGGSPVKMTAQIQFSSDILHFWPVKVIFHKYTILPPSPPPPPPPQQYYYSNFAITLRTLCDNFTVVLRQLYDNVTEPLRYFHGSFTGTLSKNDNIMALLR